MMAANPYDSKRKVQSKAFNKLLHHYESQVFLGMNSVGQRMKVACVSHFAQRTAASP